MLVQNQKDLRVANRMYGRKLPTFGYAGRNDEYAEYWRKLIKAKWLNVINPDGIRKSFYLG